jgi:hypothetical protein
VGFETGLKPHGAEAVFSAPGFKAAGSVRDEGHAAAPALQVDVRQFGGCQGDPELLGVVGAERVGHAAGIAIVTGGRRARAERPVRLKVLHDRATTISLFVLQVTISGDRRHRAADGLHALDLGLFHRLAGAGEAFGKVLY